MRGIVSQHGLRNCRVEFDDRVLDHAGVFPFFDEAGRVRLLIITARETGRILVADWTPDVFSWRWLRRYRLRLPYTELSEVSPDDGRLEDLWHFDPWWVLDADRYSTHDAVPAVKATNIRSYDESIHRMWFAPDLSRAAYVVSGTGDSATFRAFNAGLLTPSVRARLRVPVRPALRRPMEWRLRPFWQ